MTANYYMASNSVLAKDGFQTPSHRALACTGRPIVEMKCSMPPPKVEMALLLVASRAGHSSTSERLNRKLIKRSPELPCHKNKWWPDRGTMMKIKPLGLQKLTTAEWRLVYFPTSQNYMVADMLWLCCKMLRARNTNQKV